MENVISKYEQRVICLHFPFLSNYSQKEEEATNYVKVNITDLIDKFINGDDSNRL